MVFIPLLWLASLGLIQVGSSSSQGRLRFQFPDLISIIKPVFNCIKPVLNCTKSVLNCIKPVLNCWPVGRMHKLRWWQLPHKQLLLWDNWCICSMYQCPLPPKIDMWPPNHRRTHLEKTKNRNNKIRLAGIPYGPCKVKKISRHPKIIWIELSTPTHPLPIFFFRKPTSTWAENFKSYNQFYFDSFT